MIPRMLTIQGLYSYQSRQTIDFTKLTGACLFGIFGTVGSGKSSILEAITYAIYGQTDRLNLSGDNRNYNMMNLKSDELLIDFIFETGKEQTAYRSIVKGKRNSKRFEDVKALERSAFVKVSGEWMPIELDSLVEAVGLSYANFKRTIIIPQGQFQEFLQLGNKDRTVMMKELFNLERFELFYKVVSLESKNNEQIQNLKGQLLQLSDVEPGLVDVYNGKLSELDGVIKSMNIKLNEYLRNEEVFRSLKLLSEKVIQEESRLSLLLLKEPEFVALENNIVRYEQCVLRFKHLLDGLKDGSRKVTEREKMIVSDSDKLNNLVLAIEEVENHLIELKILNDRRDEIKKKAEELGLVLRVRALEQNVGKESMRVAEGSKVLEKTISEIERLKLEKVRLEGDIKRVRDEMPDLSVLSKVRTWYVEKRGMTIQLKEIEEEIAKCVNISATLNNEKSYLLNDKVFENLSADSKFDVCCHYLQEKTNSIKLQIEALTIEENHLRVRERLGAYAEALEEGSPCPLCGSLNHPDRYRSEEVKEALIFIDKSKTSLSIQIDHIVQLDKQITFLESRTIDNLKLVSECENKKSVLTCRIDNHDTLFVWDGYSNEEVLNEAFDSSEKLSTSLKSLENLLVDVNRKIDKADLDRDRFRKELEKINTSLTIHKTELSTIAEQIKVIDILEYKGVAENAIEEERNLLMLGAVQVEKDFNEYTVKLQRLNKEKDILTGSLTTNKIQLDVERSDIAVLNEKINVELNSSSFSSLDEVNSILSVSFQIEAEKLRLSVFKKELMNSKLSLEQLKAEMGERRYDEEVHGVLNKDIEFLRNEITFNVREQGKTSELLKNLLIGLETRSSLDKVLEGLELRSENIKTLKSLFKASGFVNYISSVYLQNLCNTANHRFSQITRQRLSLEITPDNSFQVIDFMNGGKRRNVKTLSGGQTFQASLSLALALADNIQKITQSNQNFFFLDEGFGSLDKESLVTVFDTLKLLRKENRIVGVISHVEEMQQEIEVHLRIENNEDRGSIIYSSWEE